MGLWTGLILVTRGIDLPFLDRPIHDRTLPHDLRGWNTHILSQEGFDKMKEVVEDIVSHVAALEKA